MVKAVDRILDKLAGARDDGDDLQVISGKLIEKDSVKEKKSETV